MAEMHMVELLDADENGAGVFAGILAPTEEQPSSPELRANAVTLLQRIGDLSFRHKVFEALRGAGAPVSDEGKALMGPA